MSTAAKVRRQLQEIRGQIKPSDLLIVTLPPDATSLPIDHYRAGLKLRGEFQSIAIRAGHSVACEIIQHLHDLGRGSSSYCALFASNWPARGAPLIEPRPGQTAREAAEEYLQSGRLPEKSGYFAI
ncbi:MULTISPECIES: hypothetical protein [Azotobacter]|uniref:hypothetical protein n=1 Tax=Azotobacter TaxID=352 RepID=UPI00103A1DBF|nr:hypothetical protein [Azotobacter chroococcum]TBW04268.1 hypothetical protein E0E52_13045 [Azotobacter chroococcum]